MHVASTVEQIKSRYRSLASLMDERMRRQWAASEAQTYGWGGVSAVSDATGMSRNTIRKGLAELEVRKKKPKALLEPRLRRQGGGRKRLTETDPGLLHAVIRAESGYNSRALSNKGASGLMQLIPDTARRYGVSNIFDPVENINGGARYLKDLLAMFNNNMELALAGYNAGENAVIRAGHRVPNYPETMAYVPKVIGFYKTYGVPKI